MKCFDETLPRLLSRYPGAKRPPKYQFDDGGNYDAVVEPFAGSAVTSVSMSRRVQNVFLADADPTIRSLLQVWLNPGLHKRYYDCLSYRLQMMQQHPETHWPVLLSVFENAGDGDLEYYGAASTMVRELTFGGVIRFNANGKMNAPMVKDRIEFLKRQTIERYRLPSAPRSGFVGKDWSEAFDALEQSDCQSALCVIDPPYFNSTCKDAVYAGHSPQSLFTLRLCVDAVERAVNMPQIKRIVICNYWSEDLAQALWQVAGDRITGQQFTGSLTQMQRSKNCSTQNQECVWTIGQPAVKQLELALV